MACAIGQNFDPRLMDPISRVLNNHPYRDLKRAQRIVNRRIKVNRTFYLVAFVLWSVYWGARILFSWGS